MHEGRACTTAWTDIQKEQYPLLGLMQAVLSFDYTLYRRQKTESSSTKLEMYWTGGQVVPRKYISLSFANETSYMEKISGMLRSLR